MYTQVYDIDSFKSNSNLYLYLIRVVEMLFSLSLSFRIHRYLLSHIHENLYTPSSIKYQKFRLPAQHFLLFKTNLNTRVGSAGYLDVRHFTLMGIVYTPPSIKCRKYMQPAQHFLLLKPF
jgi:hypothetical protein